MNRKNTLAAAGWGALLLLASTAHATAPSAEPAAAVRAEAQTLAFAPKVADGLRLTVSGPRGVYFKREFAPGEPPVFVAVDERGPLPDGGYKYELRSQPPVDEDLLRRAEKAGDDRLIAELERQEEERTVVQYGQFDVVAGSIVFLVRAEDEPHPEHSAEDHVHE